MSKNSKINNDEISLINFVEVMWKGKWRIVLVVVISVLFFFGYHSTKKKIFTAVTEINGITISEKSRYFVNSMDDILDNETERYIEDSNKYIGIPVVRKQTMYEEVISQYSLQVSKEQLLNHFIEVLNERTLIKNAIRKFKLLDASQYKNERTYEEAITKLAASVKVLSPSQNVNQKNKGRYEEQYYTIEFKYHNKEQWLEVLEYIDEFANKLVHQNLELKFKNIVKRMQEKKFFDLEDLSIKINNSIEDYDRNMADRVLYLMEQSQIAKELGITKNTIEVQTFGSQNALLSNIKTDSPFYLRGYEAIDKEVLLIRSRTDNKAFIKGLFKLEKEKRALVQDKTISRLERFFALSPLAIRDSFYSGSVNVLATEFKYPRTTQKIILVMAFGLIIGILYVLIIDLVQSRKNPKKG